MVAKRMNSWLPSPPINSQVTSCMLFYMYVREK